MSPSPDDGAATRRRLLDATVAVVVERGWGGVSTREVAAVAGATPGVVHYHFGSVDELRREAVAQALEGMFGAIVEAAAGLTPAQLVALTLQAVAEPDRPEVRLLFESVPATARDPWMQQRLGAMLTEYRSVLAARIAACHPAPLAPPADLAALVAAALDGFVLHHLADPTLDPTTVVGPLLTLLGPERVPTTTPTAPGGAP